MNLLSQETSPYLLQHANNPVHWQSWNNNSLLSAQNQNKLIIISIGYSACHWCHVMENESFEDEDVAAVMNANFVNIKIDREERPDIDAVYMKAVSIMTGRGGWPLNVVALPDGRPIWGGTYFRKSEWTNTLLELAEMYESAPEKMVEYAEKLQNGIAVFNNPDLIEPKTDFLSSDNIFKSLDALVAKWSNSFDLEYGGMERSPKFMMPNNYSFLMRFAHQTKNEKLLDFVNLTLTKMAYGGLFDTVDGGFSRYSVDFKWHVPHFEKMLYDNGQLVSLYANAYKLTKNELYKEVIEKTLNFIWRELTSADYGFYCALDADSLNHENHLEEGAFYVWTKTELQLLLKKDFELFSAVFNVNSFGFWENENYVLIQTQDLGTIAKQHQIDLNDLNAKKQNWEKLLFDYREKRPKPRLDNKILTSWNAIMLQGFVDAYKALGDKKYLEIAIKNANFIKKNLWTPEGNLMHNFSNKKATINGYLEDYCFVIQSFISIYEVSFEQKWLDDAKFLTDYCLDHFYDTAKKCFRFTSNLDQALITTHFETEDNVIPASNSVMAQNLFVLSCCFENKFYNEIVLEMLQKIIPNIDYPSAYSNWLQVFFNYSSQYTTLAILGEKAMEYANKINSEYHPNLILAGSEQQSELPSLKDKLETNQTLFYRCAGNNCFLPTSDFNHILNHI